MLNGQRDFEEINCTNIVLIPKVEKERRSVGSFTLKLDMSKALERVMGSLGFCEVWISLVIRCISSVSYSVILNGEKEEQFRPSMGLRQGDPLSPYLFLIYVEGFSMLLHIAKEEERHNRARIGRGRLEVSYLFFLDDSILFGEATVEGAHTMKLIISKYEGI
ncbi:reverse transcriptase [Gossypium australe]|uniref:Reverse transcriptase n=1 Tax=Gossypium australe TaxID=47621 RepID=A0A5B6VN82_9ROSI|nr:reverse transcriptase [Gossypium australe]